ncbi:MAG: GNAT family N-acetyltransferase [Proteobacteria bacterium]|nr:GNAT family N-acetyltransferase [Pseudomonadota bacterium]
MHVLVTKRLTLRPPALPDADDIAEGLSNWNVARMLGPVPFPYFPEDAEEWLAGPASLPESLVYTIHRERLIGVVSLDGGGLEPRLGYWLAEHAHGHGYMTEAVTTLLDHAFATRVMTGVSSSVFADNPVSLRLQEKLGFKVNGARQIFSRSRDAMVDALTTRLDAVDWARADRRKQTERGAVALAAA